MTFTILGYLKKNSISTTTTAPITAASTTIPILQTAILTAKDGTLITQYIVLAPNDDSEILTEEIAITGRSTASGAGNMTGATRGINADGTVGAGHAWDPGTLVCVLPTIGLFNAIKANFEALGANPTLAALADAPVKGGVPNGGFENAPPFTAVQTASNWIDGIAAGSATIDQYGWYLYRTATAISARFDPTVSHSGGISLKLSCTDATGQGSVRNSPPATLPYLSKYIPLLKASTKYRFILWMETINAAADAVYAQLIQYDVAGIAGTGLTSTLLSGTNNWTVSVSDFTSDADAGGSYAYIILRNYVAGNVSDAWFDDITLEEIVEDTTFTGGIPTPIKPTIGGVTTEGIDQSLDTGGAYANTYALTNALNEGATHIQTFTPTRGKLTQIGVWVVEAGTGVNWTLVVHNAGNVLLASATILAASLVEGAFNYFNVPNLWASGALHFHLYASATTGTPTCKANTSNDLETASYIQYFAKHTENVTITCNGEKVSLNADQDGILNGAIIDLDKGKYLYVNPFNATVNFSDIFSASVGGGSTIPDVVNGWDWANTLESLQSATGATARNIVLKVNTLIPVKHVRITPTIFNNNTLTGLVEISIDNVNYTTLWILAASASAQTTVLDTDIPKGLTTFYLRLSKNTANQYIRFDNLIIEADLDTSTVPAIILQPLGTQPQFSENVTLPSVATRVYFQTAKYANKNGVIVPHLEFTDGSAVMIKAIPCGMDNTGETSPCIDIIIADTTNGQQAGTGSADSTTGYILDNGEYMTFSSTTATPKVTYKMGTGTTTMGNITMNRLYLSSNGIANSATKRSSFQFNFYLGMLQEGIQNVIEKLQGTVNDIARAIHREWGLIVASGTSYALTTTLAVINFGTTGNLEVNLPDAGIYEITALIHDDMSGVTVSAAANYSLYQPYIDGMAMTNGEMIGLRTSILAAAAVGLDANTVYLSWIIQSYHPGTLVSIYGKKNSATTGAWNVVSDATGWTKLRYKRIG